MPGLRALPRPLWLRLKKDIPLTPIFHIAYAEDWRAAQHAGTYRVSTRDRTLEEVGFIHCSYASQLATVANAFYRAEAGLVLLVIEPERLSASLQVEAPAPGAEAFPHIYGPLNLDAVVRVLPFAPNADGTFTLPEVAA